MFESSKDHLSAAGEGYFEHFGAALGISATLARASICCTLHAILPGLCARSASRSIAELYQKLQRRGAAASGGAAEHFAAAAASRPLERREGHSLSTNS
jgi:hypothetical protein